MYCPLSTYCFFLNASVFLSCAAAAVLHISILAQLVLQVKLLFILTSHQSWVRSEFNFGSSREVLHRWPRSTVLQTWGQTVGRVSLAGKMFREHARESSQCKTSCQLSTFFSSKGSTHTVVSAVSSLSFMGLIYSWTLSQELREIRVASGYSRFLWLSNAK